MKKTFIFLLPLALVLLAIVYRNELLFHFQISRLKRHIDKAAPATSQSLKRTFASKGVYSKVWAHRVNTLERFRYLSNSFQGFEMDIIYDEQNHYFDVRHPPATSIRLSFEEYLQTAESKDKFFWLDMKNMTDQNGSAILALLSELNQKYKIRERVVIESNNILQLSKIADAGYFTSYYYDYESYSQFFNNSNNSIDSIFGKIDAVSQDFLIYDTLVKRFPAKPKLTWALSIRYYLSDTVFTALDNDKGVLVFLVNIKSPGYR